MANTVLELAKMWSKYGVQASYGEPVTLGKSQIIPVACAVGGFGGGMMGSGNESESVVTHPNEGTGGGGGGYAIPVGAYIADEDGSKVRFEPNPIVLAAVAIPLCCAAGFSISRIIRAAKR